MTKSELEALKVARKVLKRLVEDEDITFEYKKDIKLAIRVLGCEIFHSSGVNK